MVIDSSSGSMRDGGGRDGAGEVRGYCEIDDGGQEGVSARLTGRDDQDADVARPAEGGRTTAPTVCATGKCIPPQVTFSAQFDAQLGDVRGACLETKSTEEMLPASQPRGGSPGLRPEQLLGVARPVHGLDDEVTTSQEDSAEGPKKAPWSQQKRRRTQTLFGPSPAHEIGPLGATDQVWSPKPVKHKRL